MTTKYQRDYNINMQENYEERQKKICFNKDFYRTKEEAEVAAAYCYYQRNVRLKAYKCKFCEGYHLTSQIYD